MQTVPKKSSNKRKCKQCQRRVATIRAFWMLVYSILSVSIYCRYTVGIEVQYYRYRCRYICILYSVVGISVGAPVYYSADTYTQTHGACTHWGSQNQTDSELWWNFSRGKQHVSRPRVWVRGWGWWLAESLDCPCLKFPRRISVNIYTLVHIDSKLFKHFPYETHS